jgi:hypothetical protein
MIWANSAKLSAPVVRGKNRHMFANKFHTRVVCFGVAGIMGTSTTEDRCSAPVDHGQMKHVLWVRSVDLADVHIVRQSQLCALLFIMCTDWKGQHVSRLVSEWRIIARIYNKLLKLLTCKNQGICNFGIVPILPPNDVKHIQCNFDDISRTQHSFTHGRI